MTTTVEGTLDHAPSETRREARARLRESEKNGAQPSGESSGESSAPAVKKQTHRNRWLARRVFYNPLRKGAPTTTRQAEVLNTAMIGAPTSPEGIVIGRDQLSGATVSHDPFSAYERGIVSSPNVVVFGILGVGKSSLLKTCYGSRFLLQEKTRAFIYDKKLRNDGSADARSEGEYAEITRLFGDEPFRMEVEGDSDTTCLNLLDPVILHGGGVGAQQRLLEAMAELAGSTVLNEWERKALRWSHKSVLSRFEGESRPPVLEDFINDCALVKDGSEFRGMSQHNRERMEQAAYSIQFMFERIIADELAGLFDGETSKHVQLNQKVTTFDLSALPEDGPATSMVMAVGNAWLMGMLRRSPGYRTVQVTEEGWHLVRGPGARQLQTNAKLARALGLSIVTALHHVSDIQNDSAAIAMIKEAQTVHVYKQEQMDDIDTIVSLFSLDPSNAEELSHLGHGEHFLKIGSHREVKVKHERSALERQFTDTDAAMSSTKREEQ